MVDYSYGLWNFLFLSFLCELLFGLEAEKVDGRKKWSGVHLVGKNKVYAEG